jgi:CheY-like chemotaxis protein
VSRILVVEDNAMNRDMLVRRLQRRGHDVVVATDGREALAVAEAERPDVILLDMSLPEIDGWEAARRLKAHADLKATPVIALTAHARAGDRVRAVEAGCDEYETKPIDFARLLDKITALLGEQP